MNQCEKCKINFDQIDSLEYQLERLQDEVDRLKETSYGDFKQKALQEIYSATAFPGGTAQQLHNTILRINNIAGTALIETRVAKVGE